MATLTNDDFKQIALWVRTQPDIHADFRTWTITRQQMQAALQAIEDWQVNGFLNVPLSSIKGAIEAETGTTTNARAIALWRAWSAWRQGR